MFDCCCCHAPPASSFLTAVLQCVLSLLQRAMCVGVESPPGFGRTAAFTFGWCCASMRCSLLNKNHRHSTLSTTALPCCSAICGCWPVAAEYHALLLHRLPSHPVHQYQSRLKPPGDRPLSPPFMTQARSNCGQYSPDFCCTKMKTLTGLSSLRNLGA